MAGAGRGKGEVVIEGMKRPVERKNSNVGSYFCSYSGLYLS